MQNQHCVRLISFPVSPWADELNLKIKVINLEQLLGMCKPLTSTFHASPTCPEHRWMQPIQCRSKIPSPEWQEALSQRCQRTPPHPLRHMRVGAVPGAQAAPMGSCVAVTMVTLLPSLEGDAGKVPLFHLLDPTVPQSILHMYSLNLRDWAFLATILLAASGGTGSL